MIAAGPKRMVSLRGIKTHGHGAFGTIAVVSEEDGFPKRD